MKVKIFFSWQGTTDTKFNRNFISTCLEKAVKAVNKIPEYKDIEYEILDGVRGEPGSVAVAQTIMDDRIPSCDIFIGDLTIVNGGVPDFIPLDKIEEYKKHVKPTPNPNVLIEFGVAYRNLGVEKMIGIMNTQHSDFLVEPGLLPFDMQHLRYPLTYSYNSTTEKSTIDKAFISNLVGAITSTTKATLRSRKEKFRPLVSWQEWQKIFDSSQKFQSNSFLEELMEKLRDAANVNSTSIRLIGLSGLGKSRVLFETFRPKDGDVVSMLLADRILYYDFQEKSTLDLSTVFDKLQYDNEDKIIILDNCALEEHRRLIKYLSKEGNRVSLISVDSNPEEIEEGKVKGISYLTIKNADLTDVVDKIIDQDFAYLESEKIEKIKEFSQGSPFMAVLLSESAKDEGNIVGKFDDKLLLNKLLGKKGNEDTVRRILRSCSLFYNIGFEDGYNEHLEYIANERNITTIDITDDAARIDRFIEICNHFLKREIFERRGRFISMRPFPLAMYLAEEWLESCTAEKMSRILEGIANISKVEHRNILSESFAKQMRFLNFNPKAVSIVEKLVGFQGPFHDAKVLNTELGSRLFRSFVEVNPVASSHALYSIFGNMNLERLLEIQEGRRNLVWALGKLCFDGRTFSESARTLFLFALAENETWSNNATGEIIHLFKIFLPGTEASLVQRFEVVEWAWKLEFGTARELVLKCIKAALDASHFHRMGGAEQQGLRKLYDFEPSRNEIHAYWRAILQLLKSEIEVNPDFLDDALRVILSTVRSVVRFGEFDLIENYISYILGLKKWDSPEALKSLRHVKKYDSDYLSQTELEMLEALIKKLKRDDFIFRFKYSNEFIEEDVFDFDKSVAYFKDLGREFIENNYNWAEHLPVLLSSQPQYTFYFGQEVYLSLKEDKERIWSFLQQAMDQLRQIPFSVRNFTLLSGFIDNMSDNNKRRFFDFLFKHEELRTSLFHFISNDKNGRLYFSYLFRVLETQPASATDLERYRFNFALANSSLEELRAFYLRLLEANQAFLHFVLEGLHHFYYGKILDKDAKEFLKDIFYRFGNNVNYSDYSNSHIISLILKDGTESEFAGFINRTVIENISWENTFHLDNEVQRIYEILITDYFEFIWSDLSSGLIGTDENFVEFYALKHILGSNIGGVGPGIGILFKGNIDIIFSWARKNQNIAPARLAELVPVFGENNNKFDELHPLAERLLNEFGHLEHVIDSFSSNMGTYTWWGSLVPLLESKRAVFETLSKHRIREVREWGLYKLEIIEKEIAHEKNRDQEMYL